MPKGSMTKELRNGRYNQLRRWGVPRQLALHARDFGDTRYFKFLYYLTKGFKAEALNHL